MSHFINCLNESFSCPKENRQGKYALSQKENNNKNNNRIQATDQSQNQVYEEMDDNNNNNGHAYVNEVFDTYM